MDSSNNDSFGSFGVSGGDVGSGPVISSGGDNGAMPVMVGGVQEKRGKKWAVVAVLVVACVVIVVGAVAMLLNGRGNGGENADSKNADFHKFLEENKESLIGLVSVVKYIYSGEATLADFMTGLQEDTSSNVNVLSDGISAMERIKERLNDGPELSGTIAEIDLAENYEGLRDAISNDLENYQSFVDLTTKLYQVSRDSSSAQENLSGYGTSGAVLAGEIQTYRNSKKVLMNRYSENNCSGVESAVCNNIVVELLALQENANLKNSNILLMYKNNVGEINHGGVGSVMYYFNNLHAATGENNAE